MSIFTDFKKKKKNDMLCEEACTHEGESGDMIHREICLPKLQVIKQSKRL